MRYTYKLCINLYINQTVFYVLLIVRTGLGKNKKDLHVSLSAHYCCVHSFFIGLYFSSIFWIIMKGYQILISYI